MAANRKIAFIDLDTRQVEITPIPQAWRRKFIGGRGLGTYLACRHAEAGCDSPADGHPVVISAGLLAGTLSGSGPLTSIITRSPLTGFLACALLPGLFAAEMRWAGFDHLVITGRARRWVSLFIQNGTVQIENAGKLKGHGIRQTCRLLERELGDEEIKILACGPAGENGVRFATLADGAGHVTGRTGLGAVLGAKRVKALACRGSLDIEIKFPEQAVADRKAQPVGQPLAGGKQTGRVCLRDLAEGCRPREPETETECDIADSGMAVRTFLYMARWAGSAVGAAAESDLAPLAEQTAGRKGRGRALAEGPLRAALKNGLNDVYRNFPTSHLIGLYREVPPAVNAAPAFFSAPGKRRAYYRGQPGTVAHLDLSFRLLDCLGDRRCAGICPATGRLDLDRAAELIRINTGDAFKPRSLLAAAYRCYALERLYNLREERAARREGRSKIFLEAPGGVELSPAVWENIAVTSFRQSVARHYQQAGWNRKSLVKKKVLERLGFAELWNQFK